jgi:hypothetical protein
MFLFAFNEYTDNSKFIFHALEVRVKTGGKKWPVVSCLLFAIDSEGFAVLSKHIQLQTMKRNILI